MTYDLVLWHTCRKHGGEHLAYNLKPYFRQVCCDTYSWIYIGYSISLHFPKIIPLDCSYSFQIPIASGQYKNLGWFLEYLLKYSQINKMFPQQTYFFKMLISIFFLQKVWDWILCTISKDWCASLQWEQHWAWNSLREVLQSLYTCYYRSWRLWYNYHSSRDIINLEIK